MDLVLWLGHVIQQKFQNHGTTEASAFDFEIGKAHGEVNVPNVLDADEARIGHGFGEPIALVAAGRDAMVILAAFSQILATDTLIAVFPVVAAEPAAFIAQKFHLVLLGNCQSVRFVKGLVQAKIRHNIAKILPVHFVHKLPKVRQHLCGGGYKIEVRVMIFQVFQQQIGMDNDAIPALRIEQRTEAVAGFVRKVFLPEQGITEGQSAEMPYSCINARTSPGSLSPKPTRPPPQVQSAGAP